MLLGGGLLLLLGGGLLVLLRGCVIVYLLALIWWTMPKPNKEPANQLTVVQGTVTSANTGRPLPGVRLELTALKPYTTDYEATGNAVRTDAQGKYTLRFYNQQGLYYRLRFDRQESDSSFALPHYVLSSPNDTLPENNLDSNERKLTLGRPNTFDFKPSELHIIAVRVHHRNTGYQYLQWPDNYVALVSNRDTTVYLPIYQSLEAGIKIRYSNRAGEGSARGDTAIALVMRNPAAISPDTVQATLTFVR